MALPDWVGTFIEPLDHLGLVYMITGSVGAMAYGEPRMTTDVDVVVRLPVGRLSSRMRAECYAACEACAA